MLWGNRGYFVLMRIVKEFESSEFASKIQHFTFRYFNYLKWGLGDDEELYCKCCMFGVVYENGLSQSFRFHYDK